MTRPAGKIEYLPWLAMETHQQPPDLAAIQQITEEAIAKLKPMSKRALLLISSPDN
ncbi:MAG: hypothetical protein F6J90_09825 [Moorea sp. SIOASIH]|uniref:hypothetical protein n=1 Tax=Moorena sp. SIOASIH TaxID=2607817 RepID=UPI0013BE4A74|nr:hypothetical protein [Moorena sp. SIOASIH]NEO36607.1 hypothetical protein [Moorena sp. SIOASIH]